MGLNLLRMDDRLSPALFGAGGAVYDGTAYVAAPFGAGYAGPLRVAALPDVTGDGVPDVLAGAGEGGGPRVVVLDGRTHAAVRDFFAFEPSFRGGVYVGAEAGKLLVGAGPGGGPVVAEYDLATGAETARYLVGLPEGRTGVSVGAVPPAGADPLAGVYQSLAAVYASPRVPDAGAAELRGFLAAFGSLPAAVRLWAVNARVVWDLDGPNGGQLGYTYPYRLVSLARPAWGNARVVAHELGHAVDYVYGGGELSFSASPEWRRAVDRNPDLAAVATQGDVYAEAWAEAWVLYTGRRPVPGAADAGPVLARALALVVNTLRFNRAAGSPGSELPAGADPLAYLDDPYKGP